MSARTAAVRAGFLGQRWDEGRTAVHRCFGMHGGTGQPQGGRCETKLAGAIGLVRKTAAVDPSIGDFLLNTGLGNGPRFIRKPANHVAAEAVRPRKLKSTD